MLVLDTSAAFDTTDIDKLLSTLVSRVNIDLNHTFRSHRVMIGSSSSNAIPIHHGVPQSSVLGRVMFNAHTTPIADICKKHQMFYHRDSAPPPELKGVLFATIDSLTITTEGVAMLLGNLNPAKTSGPDNILNRILKTCADAIAPSLAAIYNT